MVNILIGCTGSVASLKVPLLVNKVIELIENVDVRVVCTKHATHFFERENINAKVYDDADEWSCWSKLGDVVLHVDLRNWADIFVIAPLDANTLGKLAHGLCDNLLTCIARAWDIKNKPLLVCCAMNTFMWNHPSTELNLSILKSWGYVEIPPVSKLLACGDYGVGAMADVSVIVKHIKQTLTM